MKVKLLSLVAAPVFGLSSMAYAEEPVALTQAQMDEVTAGLVFVAVTGNDVNALNNIAVLSNAKQINWNQQ